LHSEKGKGQLTHNFSRHHYFRGTDIFYPYCGYNITYINSAFKLLE